MGEKITKVVMAIHDSLRAGDEGVAGAFVARGGDADVRCSSTGLEEEEDEGAPVLVAHKREEGLAAFVARERDEGGTTADARRKGAAADVRERREVVAAGVSEIERDKGKWIIVNFQSLLAHMLRTKD